MGSENQNFIRKLAAILYADIVGYTSLMQEEEGDAMIILNKFQEVTKREVESYGGEIIKTYGDGALIIFDSTVDAVRCAHTMQLSFLEDPKVPLRIGIHVGEIIRQDNDIFGNGVNIASRVESMGVAGAILLSANARDKIKNQSSFTTESLGSFEFKNVIEPIEVFALTNEKIIVPKPEMMKGKIKEASGKVNNRKKVLLFTALLVLLAALIYIPTIRSNAENFQDIPKMAIMPFVNVGDVQDEFIAKGITSEIRKKMTGLQHLFIIPESNMPKYEDAALIPEKIADITNADIIVEGTILWGQDSVGSTLLEIKPKVVDVNGKSGFWTNSYEEKIDDATKMDSDIIFDILRFLKIQISAEEKRSIEVPPTDNIIAYEAYLKGIDLLPGSHGAREDFERALAFFKQATSLDSTFAKAWAYEGIAHRAFHLFGYDTRQSRLDSFLVCTAKAEAIDPGLYEAALSKARYLKYIFDYDGSRKLFSDLYKKRPNDPEVLFETSFTWQREGYIEQALETQLKVREMDPNNLEIQLETAWNAIFVQDYELAFDCRDKALEIDPEDDWGYMMGVFIYWSRGEEGDLEKAGELLKNVPDFQSTYPVYFWVTQHLYEREFEKAQNILNNLVQPAIEKQDSYYPKALLKGLVYEQLGQEKEARKQYTLSLKHMEQKLSENPDDFRYRNALAITYAGLRNKEKALQETELAVKAMPMTNDYQLGLDALYGQMNVYAALNEDESALDIMAKMMSGPCPYQGFAFTKNPLFASLQGNTRFTDLLKKFKKNKKEMLN